MNESTISSAEMSISTPRARAETIFALSNGYVGTRGTLEEGRPAFRPGTFVNGFHETWEILHAEEAYGLARTGQTTADMANSPVQRLSPIPETVALLMKLGSKNSNKCVVC